MRAIITGLIILFAITSTPINAIQVGTLVQVDYLEEGITQQDGDLVPYTQNSNLEAEFIGRLTRASEGTVLQFEIQGKGGLLECYTSKLGCIYAEPAWDFWENLLKHPDPDLFGLPSANIQEYGVGGGVNGDVYTVSADFLYETGEYITHYLEYDLNTGFLSLGHLNWTLLVEPYTFEAVTTVVTILFSPETVSTRSETSTQRFKVESRFFLGLIVLPIIAKRAKSAFYKE